MTHRINELKSYTEYNVSTPTSVFTIGFQYEHNVDHVNVYVDGVEATAAGYTIQHDSQGTVQLTPAVPSGVVRLSRETDIDTSEHTFSAGAKFTAGNMDENFEQIRHSQQEVRDNFSKLKDDIGFTNLEQTIQAVHNIAGEVEDNVAQSQALLTNTVAQAALAHGYANSANSASTAAQQAATDAQQAVTDVSTAEADVYAALAAQQTAVNNSLTAIAGGHKAYQTLADAQADQASLPANTIVEVTNDGANNGTYQWNGTTLTKSDYDPLTQAKEYTNTYAFAAKSAISDSTLLSSYKNIGIYYGTANLTLSDRPEGSYQSRQFMLKNEPYTSNGRFVLQTYQEVQIELKNEWRRVIDTVNNTVLVDWVRFNEGVQSDSVTALMLKNSVVSRAKLTDNFLYSGVIANTDDMNVTTKDGLHVVTSRPLNSPSGSASIALVQIENHNNFVRQTWQNLDDSQKVWRRVIRPNASTPTFETWKNMNPTQVPSVIASPSQLGLIKVGANLSIDENGVLSASGGGSEGYFTGKKMVCFGDSVTEFGDYPERIKNRLGLASAVNAGFGGCRMAAHESVKYTEMSMFKLANTVATQDFTLLDMRAEQLAGEGDDNRPAVARLKAVNFAEVDYITIFYGTNDWASNVLIGENTDLTADGSTFKGSINYAVKRLLETYPHLKILFVTPTWRARFVNGDGLESDTNPNGIGKYLIEYVDAIKEVAALNKIPVLDMYRESGINKYNYTLYFTDGLHPTDPAGFQHIANKISSAISASY